MKKSLYIFCIIVLFTAVSCIKDEQAYTTFTGDMVYSFLQKDSTYSEFVRILDKSGLKGMLSAYGQYTCLAPTNAAMRTYYAEHGKHFTFDSLRQGQMDTLARAHIVGGRYRTYEFTNGVLPNTNMNYHYVEVQFDSLVGGIRLNGSSRIVSKNNDVYNGVVHGINRVLKLPASQLFDIMKKNKDISIFTEALSLTHLSDSISPIVDRSNNPPKVYLMTSDYTFVDYASQRKFGYTAFVEDNALLAANGIHSLAGLIARAKQLYPSSNEYDADFTHRNNSLNQYMAYHLINKAIYYNRFFYTRNAIKGYTPDEFLETMLSNRIIRVSNVNAQVTLNIGTDYTAHVQLTDDQRALNGIYHLLDHTLVYTNNVERMLQNTRIRFDISSLFPELTNNNFRGTDGNTENSNLLSSNFLFELGYLTNIKMSQQTRLFYVGGKETGFNIFPNFQTDCMWVGGCFDISIRLLPVPPGTYELRLGYSRSLTILPLVQLYVDNIPIGTPEREITFNDRSDLGYIQDSITDDDGVKNDQILHNKGYMKAPNTFMAHVDNFKSARDATYVARKVIGTFSFTDYQTHTIRFKAVESPPNSLILIDYFELVPKSVYNPPGDDVYETRD